MLKIGGVTIKPIQNRKFWHEFESILKNARTHTVHAVTINPEYIIAAQSNAEFKSVLNNAEYTLIDGVGILGAAKYLILEKSLNLSVKNELFKLVQFFVSCLEIGILQSKVVFQGMTLERLAGVDVVAELVNQEWMDGKRVYMLGARPGIAQLAANKLTELNDSIIFKFSEGHHSIRSVESNHGDDELSTRLIQEINEFRADVLLVAYGHPWQDMWIEKVKSRFETVRFAMGVGGSFDYLAGEVARAPAWMRSMGLEWTYRLFSQPERFSRILDATWRFAKIIVRQHEK